VSRASGLAALAVALAIAGAGAPAGAAPGTPAQTILHVLDYVAVDYAEAVKDGRVADEAEFREQIDFVTQAIAMLEGRIGQSAPGWWPRRESSSRASRLADRPRTSPAGPRRSGAR
jgi:hypothetical protein